MEQVRAAEAALMATLPEGALMQRAAAGLASAVLDLLGRAYGSTVVLLVGGGDNGGDALYAGALLARRGCRVVRGPIRPPARGRPRGAQTSGRRTITEAPRQTPDLVVDGIVGIGGRPGCGPTRRRPSRRSTAYRRRGRRTFRCRRRHRGAGRPGGRQGRRHRHLRHPQGRAAGRPGGRARRRRPPRRHRARAARERTSRACRPTDVAALLPRPDAQAQKYTPRRGRRPRRLGQVPRAPEC